MRFPQLCFVVSLLLGSLFIDTLAFRSKHTFIDNGEENTHKQSYGRKSPIADHQRRHIHRQHRTLATDKAIHLLRHAATEFLSNDRKNKTKRWVAELQKITNCRVFDLKGLISDAQKILTERIAATKTHLSTLRETQKLMRQTAELILRWKLNACPSATSWHEIQKSRVEIITKLACNSLIQSPSLSVSNLQRGDKDTMPKGKESRDEYGKENRYWSPLFAIIAHQQPILVHHLIRHIRHSIGKIIVFVPRSSVDSFQTLTMHRQMDSICFMTGSDLVYGSSDLLATQISIIEWTQSTPLRDLTTHYVFLSGQDYPLRSLRDWGEIISSVANASWFSGVTPIMQKAEYEQRLRTVNINAGSNCIGLFERDWDSWWPPSHVKMSTNAARIRSYSVRKSAGPSRIIPAALVSFIRTNPDAVLLFQLLSVTKAAEEHFWDTMMGIYSYPLDPVFVPFVYGYYPKSSFRAGVVTEKHWDEFWNRTFLIARKVDWDQSRELVMRLDGVIVY